MNQRLEETLLFLQATSETNHFLKTFTSKMMKMSFLLFIYLIFIYFYKIKKIWNKKQTSLHGFEKGKVKAIDKQGLQYLFFIYVQDKFIRLNFFKTHSTKEKQVTDKRNKPIVQFCSSVIQFLCVGDRP